jgi:hypothetical protein
VKLSAPSVLHLLTLPITAAPCFIPMTIMAKSRKADLNPSKSTPIPSALQPTSPAGTSLTGPVTRKRDLPKLERVSIKSDLLSIKSRVEMTSPPLAPLKRILDLAVLKVIMKARAHTSSNLTIGSPLMIKPYSLKFRTGDLITQKICHP